MSPITDRRDLKVFNGILGGWWRRSRLWLTFGSDWLEALNHAKSIWRSGLELIELYWLALWCNPEIRVANCRALIFSKLFLSPTLHVILGIFAFAPLWFEQWKAVTGTVQIDGETFVFTFFTGGRVDLSLF